jgi:hypothetical protein
MALASGRLRVEAPVRQSAVPLALCPPSTRHTSHTSLTKCQDNGASRSRFRDHALTGLSSRASEVGSCQLIEGPSAVSPNSRAQAGAAGDNATRLQHGLESHPPCIATTDGQSPSPRYRVRPAPLCDRPALLLNRVRMRQNFPARRATRCLHIPVGPLYPLSPELRVLGAKTNASYRCLLWVSAPLSTSGRAPPLPAEDSWPHVLVPGPASEHRAAA